MITLHGMYEDGKVEIIDENPPRIKAAVEVRLLLPEKEFSFNECRQTLADCHASLSEAVVAERREPH